MIGAGPILAVANAYAENIVITASNLTVRLRGNSCQPMAQGSQLAPTTSIPVDLVNGWIYYLQVSSRGLALASKLISGCNTPWHACYGDSASALSQLPTADIPQIPCTPIDLYCGSDNLASNDTGATAWCSHVWGVSFASSLSFGAVTPIDGGTYNSSHTWTHHWMPGQMQDIAMAAMATNGVGASATIPTLSSEGLFSANDPGGLFAVHRLSATPAPSMTLIQDTTNNVQGRWVGPTYANLDWYKVSTVPGVIGDEQILFSPSSDFSTMIATLGLSTDPTINVASTTGWPATGFLFIDGEIISYTGTTATSFTGCTRGNYATQKVGLPVGTQVFIGAWFVKMVNGLIFAGYQIPS
jgi:hypothetical protein